MQTLRHSLQPHIKILLTHPTEQILPTVIQTDAAQPLPSSLFHLQQTINKPKGDSCIPHLHQSINFIIQHRDCTKDRRDTVRDYHE